jgi:hypothetical protein
MWSLQKLWERLDKYTSSTEVLCGKIHLKKLSELEVRKQNQTKISNRSAALEDLNE